MLAIVVCETKSTFISNSFYDHFEEVNRSVGWVLLEHWDSEFRRRKGSNFALLVLRRPANNAAAKVKCINIRENE